jgi:hypothetical protein
VVDYVPEINASNIRQDSNGSDMSQARGFVKLFNNANIRMMANEADLTIAEYSSLILAVQVEALRQRQSGDFDEEACAKTLLGMRQKFAREYVFGPETQSAIVVTGTDDTLPSDALDFNPYVWSTALRVGGVKKTAIHEIAAVRNDRKVNQASHEELASQIERSQGKTLMIFNMHGSSKGLLLDRDSESRVRVEELAQYLLARLKRSDNAEELSNVTMILESCHGYDFAENLMEALRLAWVAKDERGDSLETQFGVPSNRLRSPTVITMAHADSDVISGKTINDLLPSHQEGIRADGGLLGGRVLQMFQPAVYEKNNMTFFASGAGRLLEFGNLDSESNSQQKRT